MPIFFYAFGAGFLLAIGFEFSWLGVGLGGSLFCVLMILREISGHFLSLKAKEIEVQGAILENQRLFFEKVCEFATIIFEQYMLSRQEEIKLSSVRGSNEAVFFRAVLDYIKQLEEDREKPTQKE